MRTELAEGCYRQVNFARGASDTSRAPGVRDRLTNFCDSKPPAALSSGREIGYPGQRMIRRRRLRSAAWLTMALLGCAAQSQSQRPSLPLPAPAVADEAGVPSAPPDPVYDAITTERHRHGLHAELDPVLGKKVADASSISKVFQGEPRPTVEDGKGGTIQFWHSDGAPWILHVDATGMVTGYDVPTQGVAGRRTAAPPPAGSQQSNIQGLDDMVGLPIDSLIAGDFTPLDKVKLGDGTRLYTFRTPEQYFLCLSTDEKGAITGWGSTLPGLERPLRAPTKSAKAEKAAK